MIRVIAAGDFCPILRIEETMVDSDPEHLYGDVLPILQDKDLSLANLECPLTNHGVATAKSGPSLKANPSCAEGVRLGGFDVVSLANNHMFDYGRRGLEDTEAACRRAGLSVVGAGSNLLAASDPLTCIVGEEDVTVLAFAEHEFGIATPSGAGVNPFDPIANYHQIREAKKQSQNIIVMVHGGHEYYPLPSPRMVQVYRFFAEAGASMVVGHHPHVAGAYEVHEDVPIFYSLGNFLFDWSERQTPDFHEGMFVRATLERGTVSDFSLVPYTQCAEQVGMRLMTEEERTTFMDIVNEYSRYLNDEALLDMKWKEFCASKRNFYLAHALRLSKLSRWMLKRNILPGLIGRGAHNPLFLNLIRCESHHEVLLETLEAASRKQS